jgi:NAD+ synthase (glutamine-hydrolysing)
MLLPNYGVFDERRYFEPGDAPALIAIGETLIGLTVCEDIWFAGPPSSSEAIAGARLIVNASGSPYHHGKGAEREGIAAARARETGLPYALCNAVGGQDELVFDGGSFVLDAQGEAIARAAQFAEELLLCELELGAPDADEPGRSSSATVLARLEASASRGEPPAPRIEPKIEPDEAEVYEALKLGLRDYVNKNGFMRVVVALSGGIDSALVTLIAVDALGPERVVCVSMPSPHSSEGTQADARSIAKNLGVELIEIPIEPEMDAYRETLAELFSRPDAEPGIAEENLQARIRGNIVMALSNAFGWLVLTTGNKSELSVGYATLYGDMAGGFAVIKDVFKTLVYRLVRHRNGLGDGEPPIPVSAIERPPSAELRPDQRDEDSLPPYDVLDRILEAYVERDLGRDQIVAMGIESGTVAEVIRMVDRSEYKRRQAPPGIKISTKAFGRDRRLPITNRFSG